MTNRLPGILTQHDFSSTELNALRLDGEVYRVDDCVAAIDEISTPVMRAGVLAAQLPAKLIAEQRSAAWIWGARHEPPLQHEVCADIAARSRPPHSANLAVREVVIAHHDIATINGLLLTTPIRTAIDLARFRVAWSDRDAYAASALMKLGGFSATECEQIMNQRRNLPNKLVALRRLYECDPQKGDELPGAHPIDVVDRVDSTNGIQHAIEMSRIAHFENESAQRKAIA